MRNDRFKRMFVTGLIVTGVLGLVVVQAAAQTADLPRRTVAYSWSSGPSDGTGNTAGEVAASALEVVSVPGSPWMQLKFRADLGHNSHVEITSLLDGATQRLDAAALRQWNNRSAYFNGDAVEVKLFIAPQDKDVSIDIFEIVVGEASLQTKSICGVDDRAASNERRVARIDPVGCTGWIAENGKLLTAGHCVGPRATTLSFNLPPSLPNGTVQFPGPEDQYPINQQSFQFVDGGLGNDWGIFAVANNTGTGLQPIQTQCSFKVRRNLGPANVRITGFGVDTGAINKTNQTHVGPNAGSSATTMRYATDTRGGNSGSPIIDDATGEAVGIHTHGGCTASGGNNNGTSFFNANLWAALDLTGGGNGLRCPAETFSFLVPILDLILK